MPFYGGTCGTCIWSCFIDGISNEDWAEYMRTNREQGSISPVLLTISVNCPPPTASQRQEIAQFLKANPDRLQRVRASAFVLDSAVARAALTAIAWLARKPYPERHFGEPRQALKWLTEYAPELNSAKLMANIAAQVPRVAKWAL